MRVKWHQPIAYLFAEFRIRISISVDRNVLFYFCTKLEHSQINKAVSIEPKAGEAVAVILRKKWKSSDLLASR